MSRRWGRSRSLRWRRFCFALTCLGALSAAALPRSLSGTYVGDGTSSRGITGLGFAPGLVIVKGDNTQEAMARTQQMPAGMSKRLLSGNPLIAACVTSSDPDGFTVGLDARVNSAGISYYWVAFPNLPGLFVTGTYQGDGTTAHIVSGIGFSPAFVMVMSADGHAPNWRSSPMPSGGSYFNTQAIVPDLVQSSTADGFQLGRNGDVNQLGVTYFYAAAAASSGGLAVGQFVGNAVDNRAIAGVGFRPEYLLVKSNGNRASHRTASVGLAVDRSLFFDTLAAAPNNIEALSPDGFQVGTAVSVNASAATVYWVAVSNAQAAEQTWPLFTRFLESLPTR